MYINHVTLTTGHVTRSHRADVDDGTLAAVSPWLQQAINSGQQHPSAKRPREPWCAVALHPTLAGDLGATQWLADFERSVAWAWITRTPS